VPYDIVSLSYVSLLESVYWRGVVPATTIFRTIVLGIRCDVNGIIEAEFGYSLCFLKIFINGV